MFRGRKIGQALQAKRPRRIAVRLVASRSSGLSAIRSRPTGSLEEEVGSPLALSMPPPAQTREKSEAVKHLAASLLRSQQLVPPKTEDLLRLQQSRLNSRELRLSIELHHWLMVFLSHAKEVPVEEVVQESDPDPVASSAPLDPERASARRLEKPLVSAQAESKWRQQRGEGKKLVKSSLDFFKHASRADLNLRAAIKDGNHVKAMRMYRAAVRDGHELDTRALYTLFCFLASNQQPFSAHMVLMHYLRVTPNASADVLVSLYVRLCDCMRHMDPLHHDYNEIHQLTRAVVNTVLRFDHDGQEKCVPVLVSALAKQRASRVGHYARGLYQVLTSKGFRVSSGYWEHLLSMSKYNRQGDLPFAEILQRSVAEGWRLSPISALRTLENMYPFTAVDEARMAAKAISDLHRQESDDGNMYIIDLAMLESLCSSAAQTGHLDLLMLVWELLDMYNYEPSQALYEDTVVGFASRRETYGNAFSALADMEAKGMEVSRALIRGVSTQLRDSLDNVHLALEHLQSMYQEASSVSANQLNCIMSAAAERGDINTTLFIADEFKRLGLEMNGDSFSFVLEALGKHLYRSRKTEEPDDDIFDGCLEKASFFLSMMEEQGVLPTAHIIREYVELLCQANEVATATQVVLDAVETGVPVNNKSIYKVAIASAEARNFVAARRLAAHLGEALPDLLSMIDKRERELGQPQ